MPACVAATRASRSFIVNLAKAAISPASVDLNGSVVFHSGCCGASSASRAKANSSCVNMGCSTHIVPSWSNVAIRSWGRMKSLLAGSVVALTKATMAALAGPSFHEGSGSGMETQCLEILASGAEVAKLIDGRPTREERKRLERCGKHRVKILLGANSDCHVWHEVLPRMVGHELPHVFD